MMEMLVVFILIAILAQVAIVTYRNTIQDSKLDHAKALLKQIAIANQRFQIDYPSVVIHSAKLVNESNLDSTHCLVNKFSSEPIQPSILIACGYIEPRTWTDLDYEYHVCGDTSDTYCQNAGALAYMIGLEGAGKYKDQPFTYFAGIGDTGQGTGVQN